MPETTNQPFPDSDWRRRLKGLGVTTAVLALCFAPFLRQLLRFAWPSELYSHIVLVPVISAWVIWTQQRTIAREFAPARALAAGFTLAGLLWLGLNWAAGSRETPAEADRLCVLMLAFLSFFAGACAFWLGRKTLRTLAFPLAFLIFMVPLPSAWEDGIEYLLQHASAEAASIFIRLAGTPLLRDGTRFALPNITLEVAPECSGIHSSLVLLMVGLLAGYFFLRRPWARAALAASVIVLGVLRNGARIFTLAELCVHVNPDIIHSAIHKHGGPPFFALSLVPFFFLIWFLRKIEVRQDFPVG